MITFDISAFQRAAAKVNGVSDQMPFAISRALNESVKVTSNTLAEVTWPSAITARNRSFMKFALGKPQFSTKRNLRVEINDERAAGRGSLSLHSKGGMKRPRGAALAVPSKAIAARRGSRGVPKNLRPRAVANSFKKGDVLYQRVGKYVKGTKGKRGYDGRGLKLLYVLKPSTRIRADVPFQRDFQHSMQAEFRRQFPIQMREALRTAFRK